MVIVLVLFCLLFSSVGKVNSWQLSVTSANYFWMVSDLWNPKVGVPLKEYVDGSGPCMGLSCGHTKYQLWLKASRNHKKVSYLLKELRAFRGEKVYYNMRNSPSGPSLMVSGWSRKMIPRSTCFLSLEFILFSITPVMVAFMCQLDLAKGCPDSW